MLALGNPSLAAGPLGEGITRTLCAPSGGSAQMLRGCFHLAPLSQGQRRVAERAIRLWVPRRGRADPSGRGHSVPFSRGVWGDTKPPPRRLGSPGRLTDALCETWLKCLAEGAKGGLGWGGFPQGCPPQSWRSWLVRQHIFCPPHREGPWPRARRMLHLASRARPLFGSFRRGLGRADAHWALPRKLQSHPGKDGQKGHFGWGESHTQLRILQPLEMPPFSSG